MNVIKIDGHEEPFNRRKIIRTLIRMGASTTNAEEIAQRIEANSYEGISTKKILDMIYDNLAKCESVTASRRDLRTALALMKSAPDFEEYVRLVLQAHGYRMKRNQVIRGFCVTHEIDGVAEKDGKTTYLEVKHHTDPHSYVPFDVTLAAKAKLDDLREGFKRKMNSYNFDQVLIVCNTRLTNHALKYSRCIGLNHLGWNTPSKQGLNHYIMKKNVYPITMINDLSEEQYETLCENGIITLQQLVNDRSKIMKIADSSILKLKENAEKILNLC